MMHKEEGRLRWVGHVEAEGERVCAGHRHGDHAAARHAHSEPLLYAYGVAHGASSRPPPAVKSAPGDERVRRVPGPSFHERSSTVLPNGQGPGLPSPRSWHASPSSAGGDSVFFSAMSFLPPAEAWLYATPYMSA